MYHNDTRTRRDLYPAFQTQDNTLYHSWRSRSGSSRVCNLRNRSSVIENVASVASFLCYWKYLRHRKRRLCSLVSVLLKISAFSLRSIGLPNSKGDLRNQPIAQLWAAFQQSNIFVKQWRFQSKRSSFEQKSSKSELSTSWCFDTKKVRPSKENRKWGGSVRQLFFFYTRGSQTAFSDVSKFNVFTPKPSRIRKCVEPPHFSQRTLGT